MFIKNFLSKVYQEEKDNRFLFLVIVFILGLFFSGYKTPLYLFLGFLVVTLYSFFKGRYLFALLLFFVSGSVDLTLYKSLHNNLVILGSDLKFVKVKAEVEDFLINPNNNSKTILLKNIHLQNEDIKLNQIRLSSFNKDILHKGDIIEVKANLFAPEDSLIPEGFSLKNDLFFKGISALGFTVSKIKVLKYGLVKRNLLFSYKEYLKNKIVKYSSKKSAPIAVATILGERSYLSRKDITNLNKVSISHLISISGYHISLITLISFYIIRSLLSFIPLISLNFNTKKIASFFTVILLICYGSIIDLSPPSIRAILMAIAALSLFIFDIVIFSKRNLIFIIFLLLLVFPFYIYSASFILSFLATLVLISLWETDFIQKLNLKTNKLPQKIVFSLFLVTITTLVIEVALLPIVSYYFNMISLYSVIANTIIDPIFSFFIMFPLFFGCLAPNFIAKYLFLVSSKAIEFMLYLANYFSSLNHSVVYISYYPKLIFIFYVSSLIVFLFAKAKIVKAMALIVCVMGLITPVFIKSPDIMIDSSLKLVGFKEGNLYGFSNNRGESFIKRYWLKDEKFISKKKLNKFNNISCDDFSNCVYKSKNYNVALQKSAVGEAENCENTNIMIVKGISSITCKNTFIIDDNFINKYGASFIYLNKKGIKILTNKKDFFIKNKY